MIHRMISWVNMTLLGSDDLCRRLKVLGRQLDPRRPNFRVARYTTVCRSQDEMATFQAKSRAWVGALILANCRAGAVRTP